MGHRLPAPTARRTAEGPPQRGAQFRTPRRIGCKWPCRRSTEIACQADVIHANDGVLPLAPRECGAWPTPVSAPPERFGLFARDESERLELPEALSPLRAA